jgi:ABC-type multidrug transport system fused ATPase/permease subunit
LVRKPALLILDDTTSALDPATESKVLGNMRTALASTTVVLVASRPSTVALADDVVFLSAGKVTGHGTHDELLASHNDYRELVAAFEADRSPAT